MVILDHQEQDFHEQNVAINMCVHNKYISKFHLKTFLPGIIAFTVKKYPFKKRLLENMHFFKRKTLF